MSSDSDSDLEFLKHVPLNPTPTPPAARTTSQANNEELWRKTGENAILRSQLNKLDADHQKKIAELLDVQNKIKAEFEEQIKGLNNQIKQEKLRNQFSNVELKARSAVKMPTMQQPLSPQPPSTGTAPRATKTASRSAADTFNDAFVLKKPRIQPLSDAKLDSNTSISMASVVSAGTEREKLMAFLISHLTPGYHIKTVELLFQSGDVAKLLSSTQTAVQFCEILIDHCNNEATGIESKVPMLSLLYDFLLLDMDLSGLDQQKCATQLCSALLVWLRAFQPFPKIKQLNQLSLIRNKDTYLLTAILSAVDILLLFKGSFELPIELARRLISRIECPHLVKSALDLMSKHPSDLFTDLVAHQLKNVANEPSVELLFTGLSEPPILTPIELSELRPYSLKESRLVLKNADLEDVIKFCEYRCREQYLKMELSSIRLSAAMVEFSQHLEKIDVHVLSLLTSSIDSYSIDQNLVVRHSILYFWSRDYSSLRVCLNEHQLAELCVCLAKLVYIQQEDNSTVAQARQLLQLSTSSDELDQIFMTFD